MSQSAPLADLHKVVRGTGVPFLLFLQAQIVPAKKKNEKEVLSQLTPSN